MVKIIPVIMSGGSGTRLWPLSTEAAPKQFHALGSELTMLQSTATRFQTAPAVFSAPVLISNCAHHQIIEQQLEEIGIEPALVVLEPFGRNTAAVAAVASLVVRELDPDALAMLLPADHVVLDPKAFAQIVQDAAEVAQRSIVTFGIQPTGPETGFGYIQAGPAIQGDIAQVARFVEKPVQAVAAAYLAEGGYYWNAGIFLFSPLAMLNEFESIRPDILHAATAALRASKTVDAVVHLDEERFAEVPSESIDVAIMEKTTLAAVAPCDVGWADIGSWSELHRLSAGDTNANFSHGHVVLHDVAGSLIWSSEGMTVAAIGVEDLIIVANGQSVLVMPKSRSQDVKLVVERLKTEYARRTTS